VSGENATKEKRKFERGASELGNHTWDVLDAMDACMAEAVSQKEAKLLILKQV